MGNRPLNQGMSLCPSAFVKPQLARTRGRPAEPKLPTACDGVRGCLVSDANSAHIPLRLVNHSCSTVLVPLSPLRNYRVCFPRSLAERPLCFVVILRAPWNIRHTRSHSPETTTQLHTLPDNKTKNTVVDINGPSLQLNHYAHNFDDPPSSDHLPPIGCCTKVREASSSSHLPN